MVRIWFGPSGVRSMPETVPRGETTAAKSIEDDGVT